jgi:imidazolonepropionase-like amidohydrolase
MRLAALLLSTLVLGSCATSPPSNEPVTAIVGATVIHPERDDDPAVRDSTIVVRGNRIEAVGPSASTPVPPGARVIDAHGKWVIPGLIDAHVHFFQSANLYTRPDAADFNAVVPYAREVARNKARLPFTFRVWLASGVTGVVDIGGPMWNFDMRDAARRTEAAPRVAVAGPLISTVDRVKLDLGDPPIIKVASAEEARALVRRELARKPDYIKVWYVFTGLDAIPAQEAIVRATAEEAHAAGVPLAVHATELAVAKSALRAGADYLVHSVEDYPVDDEFIALMKRNHALYCPTLFVELGYQYLFSNTWRPTEAEKRLGDPEILGMMNDLDHIPKDKIPERVRKRMESPPTPKLSPVMAANLRTVWNAGIPVAMGTDAGNPGTLHGPGVFREMALMAEAGLTPLQVLRSATVNGARAMRMEADLGRIAPGRLADLVILDADPLASVANLSHVREVMKDGKVFSPEVLERPIPVR